MYHLEVEVRGQGGLNQRSLETMIGGIQGLRSGVREAQVRGNKEAKAEGEEIDLFVQIQNNLHG